MSLLRRGNESVVVYPEEAVTDEDGNTRTQPSKIGILLRASVQPLGTPIESQDIGFQSETKYRMRLVNYPGALGAQAQVEWNGSRWAVDGEPSIYLGSQRTAHVDYVIVRR
jgi:hypothetical protein